MGKGFDINDKIGKAYGEKTMSIMFDRVRECWRRDELTVCPKQGAYTTQSTGYDRDGNKLPREQAKTYADFVMSFDCTGCPHLPSGTEPIAKLSHEVKTDMQAFDQLRTEKINVEAIQDVTAYGKNEDALEWDCLTEKFYVYQKGVGWWKKEDTATHEYKRCNWYHYRMPYSRSQATITENGEVIAQPTEPASAARYAEMSDTDIDRYLQLPLEQGSILVVAWPPELLLSIRQEAIQEQLDIAKQDRANWHRDKRTGKVKGCNIPLQQFVPMYKDTDRANTTELANGVKVRTLYRYIIVGDPERKRYDSPIPDGATAYIPIEFRQADLLTDMYKGRYNIEHDNVWIPRWKKIMVKEFFRYLVKIIDADGNLYTLIHDEQGYALVVTGSIL